MPGVGRIIPSEFLSGVTRLKLGKKDPIRGCGARDKSGFLKAIPDRLTVLEWDAIALAVRIPIRHASRSGRAPHAS
jgi:hypothetical protein